MGFNENIHLQKISVKIGFHQNRFQLKLVSVKGRFQPETVFFRISFSQIEFLYHRSTQYKIFLLFFNKNVFPIHKSFVFYIATKVSTYTKTLFYKKKNHRNLLEIVNSHVFYKDKAFFCYFICFVIISHP